MTWQLALVLLTIVAILICAGVVGYGVWRDRGLRGIRVSNQEIQRENVTVSIPFMHHDFKDRA